MTIPDYPLGVGLALDADARRLPDGSIFGGSPARVLRLSAHGSHAWTEILSGPVRTATGARLARRLTDVGVLHPISVPSSALDVTVVVPVRDRSVELERCLTALGRQHAVLVVDDASLRPELVNTVCQRHGADVFARSINGGPAAARNTALAHITSDFVLFLDSDCVPPADLVDRLSGHFVDPLVGAVAPRIQALAGASRAIRYGMAASSLDLGDRHARVAPGTRVSYVPTAALLVRRAAIDEVGGFDRALRVGEDVDLVWRLDATGWRVRYDPSVTVRHAEPYTWRALLGRRFRYGTSAAPLARRHPGRLTPVVVHSWSGIAVVAMLARRPWLAVGAVVGSTAALRRTMDEAEIDSSGAAQEAVRAVSHTWRQLGRAATQFASPLLAIALVKGRWTRRATVAGFVLAGPLSEWRAGQRTLGPVSFSAARIADDVAYGAGVVTSSIRHRTTEPLRPRRVHRMLRIAVSEPVPVPAVPSVPDSLGATTAERAVHV